MTLLYMYTAVTDSHCEEQTTITMEIAIMTSLHVYDVTQVGLISLRD